MVAVCRVLKRFMVTHPHNYTFISFASFSERCSFCGFWPVECVTVNIVEWLQIPSSNFVNGHLSTTWFIVGCRPCVFTSSRFVKVRSVESCETWTLNCREATNKVETCLTDGTVVLVTMAWSTTEADVYHQCSVRSAVQPCRLIWSQQIYVLNSGCIYDLQFARVTEFFSALLLYWTKQILCLLWRRVCK